MTKIYCTLLGNSDCPPPAPSCAHSCLHFIYHVQFIQEILVYQCMILVQEYGQDIMPFSWLRAW